MKTFDLSHIRQLPVKDRWCVHSYYSLCPYAPDGSGRILASGADVTRGVGEVLILNSNGAILDRFGSSELNAGFYHTGLWQTWSADARHVYYKAGSLTNPRIVRHDMQTGTELAMDGDMEGAPYGEPIVSGLMGMLYAAGYADGKTYSPDQAPVPFQERDKHGLFEYSFDPPKQTLRLSVAEMLEQHPLRDRLRQDDLAMKKRLGSNEGLTLMLYCVRWNRAGTRCLFYFGNHCTIKERGEPRLSWVFTADRQLRDIRLVLDLSYERRGVHWSWHPDNERLIGYGPDPDNPAGRCLAELYYDGTGYRRISRHDSGGHPSVSPLDDRLLVTDTYGFDSEVTFIDLRTDTTVANYRLPRVHGDKLLPGRHPLVLDHHPVFHPDGKKVLVNVLPSPLGTLAEIEAPAL